jgi:hypothetical protein
MTQRDAETLQEFSKVLWGATVSRVRLNIYHSFEEGYSPEDLEELRLDFHEPLPVPEKIRKHRRVGSLWISYDCQPRLEQEDKILVGSGDSVAKVLDQFPKMVGRLLLKIEVRAPGGDTAFVFENDLTLRCFPARSQQDDSWIISAEDGDEVKLGPGVRVTYQTGLR